MIQIQVSQVRIPQGLVNEMDNLIEKGLYTNKSDLIRDAIRKLILENQIGSIKNNRDSIEQVKEIRNKLSSMIKNYDDFENFNKLE